MFRRRYYCLRALAAVGAGTIIAFYCPAKVLIILLAVAVVILGLSIPKY